MRSRSSRGCRHRTARHDSLVSSNHVFTYNCQTSNYMYLQLLDL